MKLKKSQLRLIIALNAVLVVLVAAIAIELTVAAPVQAELPPDSPQTEQPYSHEKLRSARVSLSDALNSEINLGGSGDDELVAAFCYDKRLYLFCRTDSTDYDFDEGAGAYCCVLDEQLAVVAFYPLGGERLEAVVLGEGGFLSAWTAEGGATLRLYGFDGALKKAANADSLTRVTAVDLRLLDGGYAAVFTLRESLDDNSKLAMRFYDFALAPVFERVISAVHYSLAFLDCFRVGGEFTLFFSARGAIVECAGAAVVSLASSAVDIRYIGIERQYTAYGVLPYSGGWAIAMTDSDGGGVALADSRFSLVQSVCSKSGAISSMLFYDGAAYYNFVGGGVAYDDGFTLASSPDELAEIVRADSMLAGGNTLFFGASENTAIVTGVYADLRFGSGQERGIIGLKSQTNIYAAMTSPSKCADCADNFGGSDIWVVRLKF